MHLHLGELADQHRHVVGHRVSQEHRAAAHAHRREERGRLDAIWNHPEAVVRLRRCQMLHAVDRQPIPCPAHLRPHLIEELHEVADLRFASRVVDERATLGTNCRHQHVLGCADRRVLQHHLGPPEHLSSARDVAVRSAEDRPQALERSQVHVNRARPEVVPARQRHAGVAEARQQRAQHHDGGPHALHEVVRRGRVELVGHIDDEPMVRARHRHTHRLEQLAHERHVGDVRHVGQHVPSFGQQARCHQLEHAVLGSADEDLAFKSAGALSHDRVEFG